MVLCKIPWVDGFIDKETLQSVMPITHMSFFLVFKFMHSYKWIAIRRQLAWQIKLNSYHLPTV